VGGEASDVLVDAYDQADLIAKCKAILREYKGDEVILNFTGGTKLMSIIAFSLFSVEKRQCIYIDSEHWVKRAFSQLRPEVPAPLSATMRFDAYVRLSGHRVKRTGQWDIDRKERMRISGYLLRYHRFVCDVLVKAAKRETGRKVARSYTEVAGGAEFVKKEGTVTLTVPARKECPAFQCTVSPPHAAKYLTGGWFEEVVAEDLTKAAMFNDIQSNVEIAWRKGTDLQHAMPKNEIDVVCMQGAIPLLVECKTGAVGQDHVYKLKSLRDVLGGKYSRAMLVSYYPVGPEIMEKAEDASIDIVLYKKLPEYMRTLRTVRSRPSI
jgi:hypothetical protein